MRRAHGGRSALLGGLSLLLMLPPSLSGQVQQIAQGQTIQGTLAQGDLKMADGHVYDVYTFDGTAGQVLTLTLRSPVFDTYLVLARSAGVITEELVTDDDGGGGTDSRIVHTVAESGPLLVIVRGLSSEATGAYTLELGSVERRAPTISAIRPGEVRVGELGADDDFTEDLAYYELFTFDGGAGDRIGVSMRSSQFDTYLGVGTWDGTTFGSLATNDDGFSDGTSDSRVVITLPEAGSYAVRATSLGAQRTGQFTLAVEAMPPVAAPTVTAIRAGETLVGELTRDDVEMDDGSYYDLFSYSGAVGESVTVTLRSSQFDTYLSVGAPGSGEGFTELGADDDSGGGTDSELTVPVPAGGVLLIRANSLSGGATGGYTISIRRSGT